MTQHARHHEAGDASAYARVLERMNRFQEPEARTAIADLRLSAGSRGLDVGCGVGLHTVWLAEAIGTSGHVVGIDASAERIAAARHYVGSTLDAGHITLRQGDGTAIDAPDRSFDWIWCSDVLHHIDTPAVALKEFLRVLCPEGTIIIKESQVSHALFLPGYPELERQLQRAEIQYSRREAGARSFQERRQRTLQTMHEIGLKKVQMRTYMVQRQAPLDVASRDYIQHVVFARNWGPRLREFLDVEDWQQRSALCEADSPHFALKDPSYYCLYPITLFTAQCAA